jgi:hypothetical protein
LKNNLAKNDIFVISGYGPFIFIRPSKYGLIMAYRCSSVRPIRTLWTAEQGSAQLARQTSGGSAYLAFQSFDFECTWWKVIPEMFCATKFHIYVVILQEDTKFKACRTRKKVCWLNIFISKRAFALLNQLVFDCLIFNFFYFQVYATIFYVYIKFRGTKHFGNNLSSGTLKIKRFES